MIYKIYLLTAIGLPPGGSSTVHIYTQAIHRTTQNKQYTEHKNFENNTKILEECGPCPDFASYTLAFALQLRKKLQLRNVKINVGELLPELLLASARQIGLLCAFQYGAHRQHVFISS
jgi:hypothetical protein